MSDKITAAAEKLASISLVVPEKAIGAKADVVVIKEIIIDVPETIGRQIIGCFGIGIYEKGSIYDKISQSVVATLNEATAEELLTLRNSVNQTR